MIQDTNVLSRWRIVLFPKSKQYIEGPYRRKKVLLVLFIGLLGLIPGRPNFMQKRMEYIQTYNNSYQ